MNPRCAVGGDRLNNAWNINIACALSVDSRYLLYRCLSEHR
jgi:hypothetical protein